MSTPGRARARREARRAREANRWGLPGPHDWMGVQVGWFATLDDLEEAKQTSHDQLIEMMGASRRGPVCWRWWQGCDAIDVLNMMHRDSSTTPVEGGYVCHANADLTLLSDCRLVTSTTRGHRR